jgi:hypothetical protein
MKSLLTLFIVVQLTFINAQCLLIPLTLEDKLESSIVVEAEVVDQFCFFDEDNKIKTSNKLMISKMFKGTDLNLSIDVITLGGNIDGEYLKVRPELELKVGDKGVFFLERINNQIVSRLLGHSFIKYDDFSARAIGPFETYPSIEVLEKKIIEVLKNEPIKNNYTVEKQTHQHKTQSVAPVISSISPTSVSGGTGQILTISGSGFGAIRSGSVAFRNADDGGNSLITPIASEYVSWADDEILVRITSAGGTAGTGNILVTTDLAEQAQSHQILNIRFARSNLINGSSDAVDTEHISTNGNGGYTFRFHTEVVNNINAYNSFLLALENWRCAIKIPFEVGGETTIDEEANDNTNVVRFDNGAELPNGVLGVAFSRYTSCDNINWSVDEIDMVFDDNTNWNFSNNPPLFNQYDFQSVALHELGHAVQLVHVIDATKAMHFSISNGQMKRDLLQDDREGGTTVVNSSQFQCGVIKKPITKLNSSNCATSIEEDVTPKNEIKINQIYQNNYEISGIESMTIDLLKVYDINGREIKFNWNGNNLLSFTSKSGYYIVAIQDDRTIHSIPLIVN